MTLTDSPSTMRPAIMAIEGVMRRCLENQMTSEMGGQLLMPKSYQTCLSSVRLSRRAPDSALR